MSTRPTRCVIATSHSSCLLFEVLGDLRHHLLGHPAVGLVVEVVDGSSARLQPGRADERGDPACPWIGDLADDGVRIDRLLGQTKGTAGHRRDQRDLVARRERRVLGGVLPG